MTGYTTASWFETRGSAALLTMRVLDLILKEHRRRCVSKDEATEAEEIAKATASISRITLLGPGIAAVVIAANLPVARRILLKEFDALQPFRALPEIEMRHHQPSFNSPSNFA